MTLLAVNRGASDVTLSEVAVAGFDASRWMPARSRRQADRRSTRCDADVRVPATAKLTDRYWTDRYWNRPQPDLALNIFDPDVPWGAPFRPTPFRAIFRVKVGDVEVTRDLPVRFRYAEDIFVGEKHMDVNVVPSVLGEDHAHDGGDSGGRVKPVTRNRSWCRSPTGPGARLRRR